jgi:hypothetical protein
VRGLELPFLLETTGRYNASKRGPPRLTRYNLVGERDLRCREHLSQTDGIEQEHVTKVADRP